MEEFTHRFTYFVKQILNFTAAVNTIFYCTKFIFIIPQKTKTKQLSPHYAVSIETISLTKNWEYSITNLTYYDFFHDLSQQSFFIHHASFVFSHDPWVPKLQLNTKITSYYIRRIFYNSNIIFRSQNKTRNRKLHQNILLIPFYFSKTY